MKTRKSIARLLSFLMVLSLLLGISAAPVYAVGGAGETATFEIREANGQTGTVQYKLDSGEFTFADSTPVDLEGVSSITIKATPVADAQVNQSHSGITGTQQAVSFDYTDLTSESGWTYQIQDNDGSITFAIEFDNNDGTGGGGNPQQPGPSIAFSADSSIEGGTLAVNNGIFTLSKDGSDLGTFRVTLVDSASQETAYTGNEEIILLNDISSVKIVMTPAEGMKANLIAGGDTPVGALSEPVFNDAGNTYTYTAYPSQFGGEQQFLGVRVWFGDEFVVGGGDAPVIWDGPQVEHQSDHGSISVKSIEIGSKTYTYQGEGKFAHNGDEIEQLEWYGYNKTSIAEEGGIRVYGDVFTEENVGVFYINFEFKPDYGYQATHVRMTEDDPIPLSDAGFNAAEAIRTFRFAVYPDAHTHFSVVFTATEDIVKANAASISEGSVELAAGELDGGSAVLEVKDADITNRGDFEAAAEGLVVSEYLDISLHNVFYKGNAEDVWSTPVENLDNPAEITLRLDDGIDTENVKIVHEKGDGEFELLDADYDPATQEITFSTSSFSNYAIAYEESGNEQTQDRYLIDFTNAPWTVDGVEVDLEGREPDTELMVWITTEDVIPLTNFDPDTMDAVLIVDENVTLRLNVDENGNTRLADVDGGVEVLPPYGATLTFAVVQTSGGEGNGGGEGEGAYTVYFGEGSWKIGDVTVTTDRTDVQYLAENDIITLENFDPETMEVRVEAEDGFVTTLAVTDGQTSISAHTNDGGVPTDIAFSVVEKSSEPGGGENPGENVYYIDLGTGSWTVGDVTVSAPEGMSGVVSMLDTETIPTEMLANFDPETMDITLTVSDGFVIYLEIDENGNTTLASTRDGVELPPYGETLTFAVVEKSSNPGGGENPGENVYYIDLGTGSWTVGDVTVSAPEGMSGVVSMLDTETIPTEMLANFDPETMDITLTVSDGFVIYLEIDENGNTTLASTRDGVELPPYGEILTFAVVAKPGNMEIVDKTEENACNADLAELTDDLISKLLTDAEKTRLENGEEVKVRLEATDISATVSQTDKDLIDSKKGNATIGMYLDIDLLKQIGSDSPVNITDTDGAVTITLKVPSSLINSNSSVTRTYQMIRVHDGVATVIPCTYNAANQTISYETDQFSTYALAYVDQQNNSGGGNTGGGSEDGGNTGGENTGSGTPSAPTYTVSFAANGGTGTMADATGISGEYTLPANGFTAPSGKQFKAWSVGGVEKAAGDKITVTANTTVTAVWEDIPAPPSNPDNPQTGDNTHIGLLFVMLLISACGMIVLLFVAPQKKGKYQR